jgi:hypothetical protein
MRVGEGTGAYGAALSRYLRGEGVQVVEVDRSDRKTRWGKGKSDSRDAYAAALAALSDGPRGSPKSRKGVEAIWALRVTRPPQRGQSPYPSDQPAAWVVAGRSGRATLAVAGLGHWGSH